MPLAAYLNFYALFWLRVVQGFVAGAAWPAMSHMVGKFSIYFPISQKETHFSSNSTIGRWIPPNERR